MHRDRPSASDSKQRKRSRYISIFCILLILGAALFLLYYHFIQPYLSEQATHRYRDIYHELGDNGSKHTASGQPADDSEQVSENPVSIWEELTTYNADICGWLTIPNTNIDYPVVQASDEDASDYYLTHNLDGSEDKNGSLFIDYRTPLRSDSRSTTINGHNMKSTGLMFQQLSSYDDLAFYKDNPVITFNTPQEDAQWKIFAMIKTNNNEKHGSRFDYFRDDFASDEDFMEFVYELQLRSMYACPVTVNENDAILILSTCTYEMNDMRFLVAARKLRSGESAEVDTDDAYVKDEVLYPDAWYDIYGGTRPEVTSFQEAYQTGSLAWYDGTL